MDIDSEQHENKEAEFKLERARCALDDAKRAIDDLELMIARAERKRRAGG